MSARKRLRRRILPVEEMVLMLNGRTFARCLDVGAGSGLLLEELHARGVIRKGLGIETDPRYFRSAGPDLTITGVIEPALERFDLIVFCDVLHHVSDPESFVVKYCRDHLTDGGHVLIKEMSDANPVFRCFNRLHDLIFSGQIIHEVGRSALCQGIMKDFNVISEGRKRVFLYDHYFVLFRHRPVNAMHVQSVSLI